MASASDWSRPKGPCTLGPGRTCMRATTLRSNQMAMSTLVSRNTTMATALISQIHHVSLLKSAVDRGRPPATDQGSSCAGLQVLRGPAREAHHGARVGVQGVADTGADGVRRQPHHVVRHVGEHRGQRQRRRASVDTLRLPPSGTPTAAAVPAEMRATGRLAVPARNCSPDCRRPASSSWCQVASTADPAATAGGSAAVDVGGADAGAVPAAQLVELGVHGVERLQPQLDARARRRACRARGGRPSRARSAPAGTGAGAPPR